jgi:hypothetical protein
MKTIIGAIALTLAVPAFAQAAPATDPHANHAKHQGMDHSQHMAAKHDCKECCEKMKGKDGTMDCMKDESGKTAAPAAPAQTHGGHAH